MFCEMLFFFTNLSQGNFLYCPRFFILTTKILNTVHAPTEMKQNLLHQIFSRQYFWWFCLVIKHHSK